MSTESQRTVPDTQGSASDVSTTEKEVAGRTYRQAKPPRRGAFLTILAWVVGFLFFFPVLWMVLVSFRAEEDAASNPRSSSPR